MLTTAVKAARRAGNIINRGARDLDLLTVTAKGPKDFVSEIDRGAEAAIVDTILQVLSRPRDPRRGRHEQGREPGRRIRLDHRSARRHDQFPARLSAVLRVDRARAQGRRPAGRHLRPGAQRPLHRDARPRRVPERPPHPRLAAPAPARLPDRHRLPVPRRQLPRHLPADDEGDDHADRRACAGPGAAALDLAYVAAGFYDGFWEVGLNPWDVAAGSLLVLEAGGLIGDLAGEGDYLHGGQVIAGSPKIFAQMVTTLAPFRPDMERDRAAAIAAAKALAAPSQRVPLAISCGSGVSCCH